MVGYTIYSKTTLSEGSIIIIIIIMSVRDKVCQNNYSGCQLSFIEQLILPTESKSDTVGLSVMKWLIPSYKNNVNAVLVHALPRQQSQQVSHSLNMLTTVYPRV